MLGTAQIPQYFFYVDLGDTLLVVTQGSSSIVLTFPSLTTFNKGSVSWDDGVFYK